MTNHYEQMTAGTVEHTHVPLLETDAATIEKMSASEAIGKVNGYYQMAMSMGANDYEKVEFPAILARLANGEYEDPADAVEEAQSIVEKKNAYH